MKIIDEVMLWLYQCVEWFYAHILPNPSKQDQIKDHLLPTVCETFFLLSVPRVGKYLGLIPLFVALYKEMIEDGHIYNFFSSTSDAQDGRVDLFFRCLGVALPYLTLFWRS